MRNNDLRQEFRVANVKQWEVADALGISEMTFVKWLRKELSAEKKALVRTAINAVAQSRESHNT
jgi:hypothetical protein